MVWLDEGEWAWHWPKRSDDPPIDPTQQSRQVKLTQNRDKLSTRAVWLYDTMAGGTWSSFDKVEELQ
jgi:hypothetical protein